MALGAHVEVDVRAQCRASLKGVAAATGHRDVRVLGMNVSLHGRVPVAPGCRAPTRSDTASRLLRWVKGPAAPAGSLGFRIDGDDSAPGPSLGPGSARAALFPIDDRP